MRPRPLVQKSSKKSLIINMSVKRVSVIKNSLLDTFNKLKTIFGFFNRIYNFLKFILIFEFYARAFLDVFAKFYLCFCNKDIHG